MFTKVARVLVKGLTSVLIILVPFQLAVGCLTGCLFAITFGLLGIVVNLAWLPLLGLLIGTSRVWLKFGWSRPLILIPGFLVALIADLFAMFAPDEGGAKYMKLSLSAEWMADRQRFGEQFIGGSNFVYFVPAFRRDLFRLFRTGGDVILCQGIWRQSTNCKWMDYWNPRLTDPETQMVWLTK